jgi:hypothetical protein
MILAYGVANLLQSIAATRTTVRRRLVPWLLLRLAGHRTYLIGIGCQLVGFLLAFLARRELPLFLVQASVAAGLGVTVLLGVLALRWRLPVAEVVLLVLLFGGIGALVVSAQPAPSRQLGTAGVIGLAAAIGVIGALAVFAVRLHGSPGSVALGALAGLSFAAAAVAARPLASAGSWGSLLGDPLLYLLVVHSVVGQLLLGLAMQRGSCTAAVAAMDAAGTVPAAVLGLALLGDRIWPGREWLAAVGFAVTLLAVIGMTRFAQPQQHAAARRPVLPAPVPHREPVPRREPASWRRPVPVPAQALAGSGGDVR